MWIHSRCKALASLRSSAVMPVSSAMARRMPSNTSMQLCCFLQGGRCGERCFNIGNDRIWASLDSLYFYRSYKRYLGGGDYGRDELYDSGS